MASTDASAPRAAPGWLASLFSAGPAKPGDAYGAPGMGNSTSIAIATSIAIFIVWYLVTMPALGPMIKPLFLPSPAEIWGKFVSVSTEGYQDRTLFEHALASLWRIFGAFFLAAVMGIPIGIAMATNRVMRGIFDPPIEFYRPLPPLGYLPLTVIWFGIGETQKLVLLFLAMFAPIVLNTRAGVRSVAIEQIHA
ncbi:MAG: taurine ABC transporter permease, partial [Methyloligellaceae bacterium]